MAQDFKTYSLRVYPNKTQQQKLKHMFGCKRWIYNWTIDCVKEAYANGEKFPSAFTLNNKLTLVKKKRATKWLQRGHAQSLQASVAQAITAYQRFFKKLSGFPRYKKRSNKESLQFPQKVKIDFDKHKVTLPKIGKVTFIDPRRFDGKIKTVTLVKTPTNKYYAQVLVQEESEAIPLSPYDETNTIGIDMGIKTFLTTSTGVKIDNPRHLQKRLKHLKLCSKQHSRKQKGSKNRAKSRLRLAKAHEKVAFARKDFLHKTSKWLICENQASAIAVENLNVVGMIRNKKLARHIADVSWSTFFELLTYKAERFGVNILQIGRFEPSSKRCSCGYINQQLTLNDREWCCPACGTTHDRDVLAAQNIKHFALTKAKESVNIKEDTSIIDRDGNPVHNRDGEARLATLGSQLKACGDSVRQATISSPLAVVCEAGSTGAVKASPRGAS